MLLLIQALYLAILTSSILTFFFFLRSKREKLWLPSHFESQFCMKNVQLKQ